MSLIFRIAQEQDRDSIYQFEQTLFAEKIKDEHEREIASWTQPWRKESLEHYLKIGCSFLAEDLAGKLNGYFLAQPLGFFSGQTQVLWVEHFGSLNESVLLELVEFTYKLGRDKHFQLVLMPETQIKIHSLSDKLKKWSPLVQVVKTTRAT